MDRHSSRFIHVIDSAFDPDKVTGQISGYDGTFRIIDQLLWTDLYALHVNRACQALDGFWSLASEHPEAVYVGPTTGVKRRKWRKMRSGLGASELGPEPIIGGTEI
jgi:hypothetical protein